MFFSRGVPKPGSRRFAYTPYYYHDEEEAVEETAGVRRRIRFKRVRRRDVTPRKSVRIVLLFAIMVVVLLLLFWDWVQQDVREGRLEDVRIEEVPRIP